jgi:RNA polymerase sigma factor (sigma-70 family)
MNTVRDTARARASRVHVVTGDPCVAGDGGPEEAPLSRSPDLVTRTPEENAIRNEMVACYLDFVDQLPPDHGDVFALSEFEGLSNAEIARRLSLSVGTVKIRLHRARARLNEELRRNCRCYYNDRGELMAEPKSR